MNSAQLRGPIRILSNVSQNTVASKIKYAVYMSCRLHFAFVISYADYSTVY